MAILDHLAIPAMEFNKLLGNPNFSWGATLGKLSVTQVETRNTKKCFRCDWCWGFIEPATKYKRYRTYQDREASTIRMHPECYESMVKTSNGYQLEWIPG